MRFDDTNDGLGGYLALRGITLFKNYFRTVIAGAPVTDWKLYDTGYTERYLGLLETEEQGRIYDECGILSHIEQFPDE